METVAFDIETSYLVVPVWRTGKQYVSPEHIFRESKIICIAWKLSSQKKIHHLVWDENQDDRDMVAEFVDIMDGFSARGVPLAAHNGDSFDLKTIRTRCLKHRLPMFPKYASIDTLKACRALFRMHSNKLAQVAKFLGLKPKIATGGMGLWIDVIERHCAKALRKMVIYCKHDTELVEEVLEILDPYMPVAHPQGPGLRRCVSCGGSKVYIRQRNFTVAGYERLTMRCEDCNKSRTVAGSRMLAVS